MQWTTKKGKRWKEENVRGKNDKREGAGWDWERTGRHNKKREIEEGRQEWQNVK